MSKYIIKKNNEDLYIKDWGSTPTHLHFFSIKRNDNKSVYTDDIREAKIYKSKGGAKSSVGKYINLFHHTIKELKLTI